MNLLNFFFPYEFAGHLLRYESAKHLSIQYESAELSFPYESAGHFFRYETAKYMTDMNLLNLPFIMILQVPSSGMNLLKNMIRMNLLKFSFHYESAAPAVR